MGQSTSSALPDTQPATRPARLARLLHSPSAVQGYTQGRNHWGVGGPDPQKIWTGHPNFLDEECDYRYVTHCSARNWVYHPYVLYNNLDQGIGPPTLKTWLRPWIHVTSSTKPEVQNVLHCRQRRTGPHQPRPRCTENFLKFGLSLKYPS